MEKLIQQLRTTPQFNSFELAVKENLNMNNSYVEDFAPEKHTHSDEREDNGSIRSYPITLSDDEILEEAIDNLLADNRGDFEEFVHETELREPITELIRFLISEIRRRG